MPDSDCSCPVDLVGEELPEEMLSISANSSGLCWAGKGPFVVSDAGFRIAPDQSEEGAGVSRVWLLESFGCLHGLSASTSASSEELSDSGKSNTLPLPPIKKLTVSSGEEIPESWEGLRGGQ